VLAHARQLFGERIHVHRTAVGERVDGTRQVFGIVRIDARQHGPQRFQRLFRRERRHVDDLEPRRAIAQQTERARDVPAGQDESIAARGQAVDEFVEHAAQAGEALEGSELEELVEEKRGRRTARRPRARQELHRGVE
jgi:hypothetical protein